MNRPSQEIQERHEPRSEVAELEALVEFGMRHEALKLAASLLKRRPVRLDQFQAALDAVLTQADQLQRWTRFVERAFLSVSETDRPQLRCWMMSFRNSSSDSAGVLQLMPEDVGEMTLVEYELALEAALDLDRKEAIKKLAALLPQLLQETEDQMMRSLLQLNMAEIQLRDHNWAAAVKMFEAIQAENTLIRNGVAGVVEVYAVQSWLALQKGIRSAEQFKLQHSPAMELTLPGNDAGIQEEALKEFRGLQEALEKVLPAERRKELGLEFEEGLR